MEIINQLENTLPYQFQENFRNFKREGIKYNLNEWITPQAINKQLIPEPKRHQVNISQVVNSIYKITDKISSKYSC